MIGARRLRLAGMAFLGVMLLSVAGATGAAAHPLGNFTINHYTGVRVTPEAVLVDRVIDLAEIPTFRARTAMDADGDGQLSDAEVSAWRDTTCRSDGGAMPLSVDGRPVAFVVDDSATSFAMGQGALVTRLVCAYRADLPRALTATAVAFRIEDTADAGHLGWREIVVEGDRASISGSDAPGTSDSARLTSYPTDLLSTPADQVSASWTAVAGGTALPPFRAPELDGVAPAPGTAPGGINELGGDIAALFQARELTLPIVLLSLLVAAGLGALHALSPGHGKTVMAAYLVGSRGTARQALLLGTTVTLSHTLGVLVLGVLSMLASSVLPVERLYPILGSVSGAIVIAIGGWLVLGRVRVMRAQRAAPRTHVHAHHEPAHEHGYHHPHEHGDGHDHPHEHGHGHPHEHGHEHAHPHEHEHEHGQDHPHGHVPGHPTDEGHQPAHGHARAADGGGWHSHGGVRHSHLPPAGTSTRGLFALGLAGGLVPSASAIILLLGSVSLGRPAYGIVLTIAFGIGMAVVLMGVGVLLVRARGLLERVPSRPALTRLTAAVPTFSAVVVLSAGVLITTQALATLR